MCEPQEERTKKAIRQLQEMQQQAPPQPQSPPPQPQSPKQIAPPHGKNTQGLLQFLHLDSDALLILPLLLLLMREGADDQLLLALLYILL